jgi:hypothetical protein
MINDFTIKGINDELTEKVFCLQAEAEFQRSTGPEYAIDANGRPLDKLAVGNVPLEHDLWEGLRNPALIGIYPAGIV